MSRLTITLEDTLYQALKEASIHQGISIGKIIEEALLLRGIKPTSQARELVAQVRQRADLCEEDVIELALDEVRAQRTN